MRLVFGIAVVIGLVLWLTGNLTMPTDVVNEMLPAGMQHPVGLFGLGDGERVMEVQGEIDLYEGHRLRADVLSIQDGDTLTASYPGDDDSLRIRLLGIDTPESDQPGGETSERYLSASVDEHVFIEPVEQDQYGRLLAVVRTSEQADVSVNYQLVRAGTAYRCMSDDAQLAEAETEAQKAGRGVWADPSAIRPPPWRPMHW